MQDSHSLMISKRIIILVLCMILNILTFADLKREAVLRFDLKKDRDMEYYLYLPKGDLKDKRIFISVHGQGRDFKSQIRKNLSYVKKNETILIVPHFDKESFSGYNNVVPNRKKKRSDLALIDILEEVKEKTGANTDKIYLSGYSAGAQFAHRFAMLYPEKIEKLIVAAAGMYTMPDSELIFPDGIDTSFYSKMPRINLDSFLSLPILVLVGENDTDRGDSLTKSDFLDKTQGMNRVIRAKSFYSALKKESLKRKKEEKYKFETIPNTDHSYSRAMANGMGDKIWNFINSNK